ncbi:MAG: hypothetical protein LBG70_01765 [Bifidobacteriaceae bacterium]|jgi:hypothetical protein|nr:hypothetical protein [Bifidobacteriaceae bacterium]
MTGCEPVPRPGVYQHYWHFVGERQRIFEQRAKGLPGPWTSDPILAHYKFCNVYRAADRVSQYMIREVCYGGATGADLTFQIVAFRTFSRNQTWDGLTQRLGSRPTLEHLASGQFEAALTDLKASGEKLYTGAFILCANDAFGRRTKHLNHVEMFKAMFLDGDLAQQIVEADSLESVYTALHTYPLMGDFMSYQTAIDLNYSELIDFSENDFTKAGPGALRGIAKCFTDTAGLKPEQVVLWMVEHQQAELERLGIEFHGLWGRPLQAIDCQNVFCETDKYCRQAVPELASNRSRIKTVFAATTSPIEYFFPPKWGINSNLPPRPQPNTLL